MLSLQEKLRMQRRTLVFILTLGLLACCGMWLLAYSTPFGLGINDDSIAYIAGARSILSGNGYRAAWLATNSPVTHFPPGFPFALASIGYITGMDPIRGARALNGLIFGINIALTGILGYRMSGSRWAGILAAALTLLSSSFLHIHARAMSEPMYLALMLLAFILLGAYFRRPLARSLILIGALLGIAYLTRYAALALLTTMLAAVLILHAGWRTRIARAVILGLSALPWILAWSIRNRIVGGSYTNRVLGWHPVTVENWGLGVSTIAEFFVPVNPWRKDLASIPGFFEGILLLAGFLLLLWVLYQGLPSLFRPAVADMPKVLPFTQGLYIIIYLLALVTTMTLFDPATRFQVRILSPIYPPLILLLVTSGTWQWKKIQIVGKSVLLLTVAGCLGMFAYGQYRAVQNLRLGGVSFANEKWSDLEAITYLDDLPQNVLILSNEPGVVYLYTGRPSGVLPKTESGITDLKPAVLDGEVVIALFRVNSTDPYTLQYYYDLGGGLYLTDYSNTWIYSDFPEQEK
jgi:4-amino-4-deoxy-L-arabinose transferase-like glycosyltransferase